MIQFKYQTTNHRIQNLTKKNMNQINKMNWKEKNSKIKLFIISKINKLKINNKFREIYKIKKLKFSKIIIKFIINLIIKLKKNSLLHN